MNNKIKIVIVTGFLGAGKTTLINNLLKFYQNKKLGMIVNDFGKIPVDSEILKHNNSYLNDKKDETKIVKIANGSIFCSCLESVFIDGLNYYLDDKPEILIIETSGISDPSSMKKIIINNKLEESYEISEVLCLLDSSNFLKMINNFNFIPKQIKSSNYIIINKIDLVDNKTKEEIKLKIAELNPDAEIIETEYSEIEFNLISSDQVNLNENLESCNTPFNRPLSYTIEKEVIELNKIKTILSQLEDKIIRVKGYFSYNNDTYLVNGFRKNINIDKINYKPDNLGVSVISDKDHMQEVIKSLKKI